MLYLVIERFKPGAAPKIYRDRTVTTEAHRAWPALAPTPRSSAIRPESETGCSPASLDQSMTSRPTCVLVVICALTAIRCGSTPLGVGDGGAGRQSAGNGGSTAGTGTEGAAGNAHQSGTGSGGGMGTAGTGAGSGAGSSGTGGGGDGGTNGGQGYCNDDTDCVFDANAPCCGECLASTDPRPPAAVACGGVCPRQPDSCACVNNKCTGYYNPTNCPATFSTVAVGATCDIDTSHCDYMEGRCHCEPCAGDGGEGTRWDCRMWDTGGEGCPPRSPPIDSACSTPSLYCPFDSFCGVSVGDNVQCMGGLWQNIPSPLGTCIFPSCGFTGPYGY
jgi:hypothetical protein